MNTDTVIETTFETTIEPVIETVIELLRGGGLEVEVMYEGPASGCPACSSEVLSAAA